ncbi:MAG: erythromycin esterase family protein [Flammeovirgaceae bacterium]
MKRILVFIVCLFLTKIAFSQQRLNLDFEKESVEGVSRPWGWALDAWGTNVFSMDTTNVKSGKFSLKVSTDSLIEQLPALQYNLEPFFISGKVLSLKGNIQSQIKQGKSYISAGFVSVNKENNYIDSSKVIYEINADSNGWKTFETSFTIPENVTSVFLKIGFEGKGTVWYDNLRLIINGKTYESLPVADTLSVSQLEWIIGNSLPFDLIPKESNSMVDFSFLRSAFGNSRIVALGESTHGTSEFFTLKYQVFRYAVEQLGFRVFALEDNQLACEKVNQYVLGKLDIRAEEAMSHLFAVWYTQEMKAMIEWIKEWNISHQDAPVYFAGFDMQDYKLPLKAVTEFLKERNRELLSEIEGFESFASNTFAASDSIKRHWLNRIKKLYQAIETASDGSKQDKIELQHVKLLQQFTENVLKGHWSLYRDEAMAENIKWLGTVKYPKDKIFVWAHDVHVSKSFHPNESHNLNYGIAMGNFLRKTMGDDYKSYGLMTYSGAYLALKSYTNYERVNAPLYLAPKGSLEEALHQVSLKTKQKNLFLNFQDSVEWLQRPLPFRFANHVTIDYGFWQRISLPFQFDGVFFIDETNPSNYLNEK